MARKISGPLQIKPYRVPRLRYWPTDYGRGAWKWVLMRDHETCIDLHEAVRHPLRAAKLLFMRSEDASHG